MVLKETKGVMSSSIKKSKGYHQLIVWQKSKDLVVIIYHATRDLPASETFGLASQLRRAAISVAANLAEGYSRGYKSPKEALQFYSISAGSLTEIEALLEIANDVYPEIFALHYDKIETLRDELAFLLTQFIKSKK